MATSPVEQIQRARRFLVEELWRADAHYTGLMGWLVRSLQLASLIVRGFLKDRLLLQASALTYMTSLAIVPVLVVLLSIIKWLGLSRNLVVVGVNQFLAGSPEAVDRIMQFVEGADVGALGSAGGAVFFVTTVLSLRQIEETFNEIWGVVRARSFVRRFTNYLALLVTVPLVVGSMVSLAPNSEELANTGLADLAPAIQAARTVLVGVGPVLFLFVSFMLAYALLPNTRVKVLSAALGAAVASLLFSVAQYFYVTFSVGAARYNALFGGFAVLPLLLVWIYLSWAIVLLGAEIANAHQSFARLRREARDQDMEPAEREAVGMRVALEVARVFRDRWAPQSAERLAVRLGCSLRIVSELLVRFEQAGIVTATMVGDTETGFQLGRPAEGIRVGEVLAAIRGRRSEMPTQAEGDAAVEASAGEAQRVLAEVEAAVEPLRERSLADLLEHVAPQPAATA